MLLNDFSALSNVYSNQKNTARCLKTSKFYREPKNEKHTFTMRKRLPCATCTSCDQRRVNMAIERNFSSISQQAVYLLHCSGRVWEYSALEYGGNHTAPLNTVEYCKYVVNVTF